MGNDSMAITNYVFMTTAVADEIIAGLDEKLSENDFAEYVMSREVLEVVRETMHELSELTKKLFETNQAFTDALEKVKQNRIEAEGGS